MNGRIYAPRVFSTSFAQEYPTNNFQQKYFLSKLGNYSYQRTAPQHPLTANLNIIKSENRQEIVYTKLNKIQTKFFPLSNLT